jgi:hypothetical protein
MGGGSYDRDVYTGSSSGGWDYSSDAPDSSRFDARISTADPAVLKTTRRLKCDKENPIVVAMDVTGSMGIASKVIYDKMPMFFGQIKIQDYLPEPSISFAAVGDTKCDSDPIQICDFAEGIDLDAWLEKLYLEGGGGGQYHESYEMFAYYYGEKVDLTHPNKKPFMFFIGDEGFYPTISGVDIKRWFNITSENLDSAGVFEDLMNTYNVFLVHKPYSYSTTDAKIVRQWTDAIGQENVLLLEDPKSVVDVMLGAIALVSGSRDLDTYVADLKGLGADPDRTQTPERIDHVTNSLKNLSDHVSTTAMVKANVSRAIATKPKRKVTFKKKKRV